MSWLKEKFAKQIDRARHRGPRTYWNGERTPCRIVRVVVAQKIPSGWWCAGLEGTVREAVRVEYGASKFYLDNESHEGSPAGSAWGKVTGGRGSPRWGHRSLPVEREIAEVFP
jgi:hypothetical protein